MHPVLGTMMPEICEAPHLPTSRFQSSFGSVFSEWGAFISFSVLATTNDIEQLRTLALAMVQNTVSENAKKEEKLRQQNTSLQQRILLLEEMLKLAHQQRFGKKGETLAGMQRSLFEEDVDADIAAVEAQLDTLLPAEEKRREIMIDCNANQ